ncbi:enoyl-CoA hydratase/isomerase family protein [Thermodesulfobacteriota bacterium]
MEYENLIVERKGHVATVQFNRPDKLNTLSIEMMHEIDSLAKSFEEDENTRAVIFTGSGKNFCAGVDLNDHMESEDVKEASMLMKLRKVRIGPQMIRSIYEINQITIAAINGFALGGGACIAAACDFRIGAEGCKAGFPEVNLAMNLSWLSLPLVVHLIGPARAKHMVISADRIEAEELFKWGFLDKLVPFQNLMKSAMEMAEVYASKPPLAAQMVKRSVNAISSALDQAIMHMDSDQFMYATSGEDFLEAVKAFFEKRKGIFKGN